METSAVDVSGLVRILCVSSDASTVINVWGATMTHPSDLEFPSETFVPAMVETSGPATGITAIIGLFCSMNSTTGGATSNRMFFPIPFRVEPGGIVTATSTYNNATYGGTKVRGKVTVYFTKSTIIA